MTAPLAFSHREHLQLAWESIRAMGLTGALVSVPAFLRGLATAAGQPHRYHETVTIGFLLLVADRYQDGESFETFCDRNGELLGPALTSYWREDTLASARARARFVFPDLR